MTGATSPGTGCRSADTRTCIIGTPVVCLGETFVFPVCQDVLYSVEAVVLAGGYVIHQVTAADSLKTGDQVQLRLDQVIRRRRRRCAM